uniref:Uncharacterized protein n=1 Tax=Arundo donax TaxID=35708 RepID=A0A0A9CAM5_ARUDO
MLSITVACSFSVHMVYVDSEDIAEFTSVDLPAIVSHVATTVILRSILFIRGV